MWTWCGFIQNKENYNHKIIPGGFHDPQLYSALEIFDKLANNAEKYSTGASSNDNESLNAIMASKEIQILQYVCVRRLSICVCCWSKKHRGRLYKKKIAETVNLSSDKSFATHFKSTKDCNVKTSTNSIFYFQKKTNGSEKIAISLTL